MKRRHFTAWILAAAGTGWAPAHAEPLAKQAGWPLVAMNISVPTRGQSVATRLQWAKAAGFTAQHELGIQRAVDGVAAYDAAGMRLAAVYEILNARKGELPDGFAGALEKLKAHRPQLWLAVSGPRAEAPGLDARVVERVRKAAELAEAAGLQVALYPHTGFYVETVADALRLATAVDRRNVGVCFNLCHHLRTDPYRDWKAVLEQAEDRLFAVSISGADADGKDWNTLIQPLDRGDFPLAELLAFLRTSNYTGTLAVQDFGITEPATETLARSQRAYQGLLETP